MSETDGEDLRQLRSRLPSERSDAARRLALTAGPQHIIALTQALQEEPVPTVRGLLNTALKRAHSSASSARAAALPGPAEADAEQVLERVPGVISHELLGSIGSLRYFAQQEISSYDTSMTKRSIEALRRRIDGLSIILQLNRQPRVQEVVLGEFLRDQEIGHEAVSFIFAGDVATTQAITTDADLLAIALRNTYQNAAEAQHGNANARAIIVDWDVTDTDFWITVENSFVGSQLSLDAVRAEGISSKVGHKGMGLTLIDLVCDKLGYELDLAGASGIAVFSMRGPRYLV